MTITLDAIMACNPCPYYTRDRVADLLGGPDKTTTIQAIARDTRVPAKDRIWILCHLEPVIAVDFARWCAERAKVHADADDAAYCAAHNAADDAADAADAAAARAAYWAAYWSAGAADAAYWPADAAARAAERDAQCEWWELL